MKKDKRMEPPVYAPTKKIQETKSNPRIDHTAYPDDRKSSGK